jgi:acetyl esterase/lipase
LHPPTTQQYLNFCSANNIVPNSVHAQRTDQDGKGQEAVAHWIGSPDANVVLLYLHGGGYTQGSSPGYFPYWNNLISALNASGKTKKVSVLLLAYTLAPEAIFPTQLQETASMLSHLINETGRKPSSILLAGDSAGGGLAFSLLSHLLHPHSEVPVIELNEPLLGLLVYSPWVSFSTETNSFLRNADIDMLVPLMLRKWAAMYLGKSNRNPEADPGPVSGDSYTEPASNDSTWWDGGHRFVDDVFVWFGGSEMLADSIESFSNVFMQSWKDGSGDKARVVVMQSPHCAHIEPLMDAMMNPNARPDYYVAISEWLQARLAP